MTEPDERTQRAEGVPVGDTDPDSTPGGATTSPAEDELPAEEVEVTRDSDPGVGPAHYAGTTRGEEVGERPDETEDEGREKTGEDAAGRPVGESTARDTTSVDPQEGST